MSLFTKEQFPEKESEPNWIWTWSIRAIAILLMGTLCILIYAIPLAFYFDGTIDGQDLGRFALFYYPLLLCLSYFGIQYLRRIKGDAIKHICVNNKGVFYKKANGTEASIRYKLLESSPNHEVYDVFAKSGSRYSPTVLKIIINGAAQTLHFDTDVAYSYYTGNSRSLRSHFIQGVALFRPDLRIASSVYSEFYINRQNYEFDRKSFIWTMVVVVVFIILLFLGIEWYMGYRFGHSLLY